MDHSAYEEGTDVTSGVRILELSIVTPEATVLQTPAQFIAVPLYDGELGIAPGRAAMVGRLGFGELRITEGQRTSRYYVDGGFVHVLKDQVVVLTNRAEPAEKLDLEAAQEQLRDAQQRPADTAERMAIRERLVTQARAQIRMARRTSGAGAGH